MGTAEPLNILPPIRANMVPLPESISASNSSLLGKSYSSSPSPCEAILLQKE